MNNHSDPLEIYLTQKAWYAVYTKSRHEKASSKLLMQKGFKVYLPEKHISRKWSDRTKKLDLPLFPGYTFVRAVITDKENILATRGIVRILNMYPPSPVPDEQIITLRRFEGHEVTIDPFIALTEGNLVRVKRGPFKGSTGILVRKDRHHRLVVSLKVLMQSASVEIDALDVEKIY